MKVYTVVVLLALATLASATDTVELDKCVWGESYWCSGLRAAKTCGAVKHCMSTVWKNQRLAPDPTEVCEFCEAIIDDVHRFIKDNKTEDDVAHFLASACGIIPDDTIAAACKILVKEYIPEIMQLLSEDISPQVVCYLMKMCKGLEDQMVHYALPSRQFISDILIDKAHRLVTSNDTQICNDCKKFFGDIRDMITSKSMQEQLEKLIEQEVCAQLGTLQQECSDLVKEFLPEVLSYISQYYDPNIICLSLGFCNKPASSSDDIQMLADVKHWEIFQLLKKIGSVEECMLCKTIFAELQAMDRNAKIQAEVENFLKLDICSRVGTFKQRCTEIIDRFAPSTFELLATMLDPDTRCRGFGFCPNPSMSGGGETDSDVVRLSTPLRTDGKSPSTVNVSPECAICEFIMKELESLIQKNSTEEEIIEALNKVCGLLPATLTKSCNDFVNTYGRAIIALLEQELDPTQVCSYLGLCTSSSSVSAVKQAPVNNDDLCIVCETLVQYVEALLEQNSSVAEVEIVMKKVCSFLPDTMKTECLDILATYGPLIIHLIATEYTPKQVCKMAKLCDDNTEMPIIALSPAKPIMSILDDQCTMGPAFWCASRGNADLCDAVDHCKQFVWKN